jgi:hypothetical protein
VVIYWGMAEPVSSYSHSQPSVYERASDEEVDDPVCPPPPREHESMKFWPLERVRVDLPVGEGT